MFNKSFIQDCLEENAKLADLDKYISYWHENDTGRTLSEFLGLTSYEYQEWLRGENSILGDILRCRREGIEFANEMFNKIMKEEVFPYRRAENIIHYFEDNGQTMDVDDKNLIANAAYKYDVDFAEELVAGIDIYYMNTADINKIMLANAKNMIARLPDETMGYTELHNYGYQGYDMYPLSAERALELYFHDIPIYRIYPDNTEQLMEEGAYQKLSEDIRTKNKEAVYGVERDIWDKRRETIKEINLINMGRDYLKLYAKYDEKAAVILKDLNKESGFSLRFAENVEKDNKESIDAIIYNLTAIGRVAAERKNFKEAEECGRLLFLLKEYKNNKNLKEDIRMEANIESTVSEKTGKEFVTVTVSANKIKPFKGKKDGKEYYSIDAGQGYSYVRPAEQLRESVKTTGTMYFTVPKDYDFTLKRSRADGQGGFASEELKVTVNELKARHEKYDDTPDFVKISISAKRVVSSFTSTKSGEPIEYSKIMAPEGMTYIRKKEQIHDDAYNEGKKYFMMPKGQEITLEYKTDKITGYTSDNKPIHETERITVTAEKLKEMYEAEKSRSLEGKNMNDRAEEDRDNTNPFVEVQTPTEEEKAIDFKRRPVR